MAQKNTFVDANFPRTDDGRVFSLGIRPGEVANRIVTVGSPARAEVLAQLLDGSENKFANIHDVDGGASAPPAFRLVSERGFLTITGRYHGTPISIVSIGIGFACMDLFVREVRECVSGDLVIVRFGTCGGLGDNPVGTVVVPAASVSVRRNYDYDFALGIPGDAHTRGQPYIVSNPVYVDEELRGSVSEQLRRAAPLEPPVAIVDGTTNASTDSFYSSQGRQTRFPDRNESLIDDLLGSVPGLATFEMETFHLLHLAFVWNSYQGHVTIELEPSTTSSDNSFPVGFSLTSGSGSDSIDAGAGSRNPTACSYPSPTFAKPRDHQERDRASPRGTTTLAASGDADAKASSDPFGAPMSGLESDSHSFSEGQAKDVTFVALARAAVEPGSGSESAFVTGSGAVIQPFRQPASSSSRSIIRAAAAQIIVAQRRSREFISPKRVVAVEVWAGRAILDALSGFYIPDENLHPEDGSVWDLGTR